MTVKAQDSLYLIGTITGDSPEHRIGEPIGIGDVNGDGYDDFMITMLTGIPGRDQAVVKLYLGSQNFDLNADVIFHYPASDTLNYLGRGYGIGDVNNDGYDDFIISGTFGDWGIPKVKIFLYYGGETIDTIPVGEFYQPNYIQDHFGDPVVGLGDINQDGYNDFAVGSNYNWTDGKGFVFLFWGGDTISWERSITLSSNIMNDFYGSSIANIRDINNDNVDDIAVGAPDELGYIDTAKVYIYFGESDMTNKPADILISEENEFGRIIKNAGDLNSDGITDFCMGGYGDFLIYLTQLNNPLQIAGYSTDANGDINNDGYDDLIVGDDWKIKIYLGSENFDTNYDLSIDDIDSIGFTFYTSIAGDINNDGYDEIFAFSPYFQDPDNPLGRAFIYSYNNPNQLIDEADYNINEFHLYHNYPNPFNPSTNIAYSIPRYGLVTIKVYNTLGEEIATLVNGEKPAGIYEVKFDGSSLPSGVYIYRLTAEDYSAAKKFILLK